MENGSGLAILLIGVVVLSVVVAGCSEEGAPDTGPTEVPTTASIARYQAGDIIGKRAPAASTDTLLLIVKYDAAGDTYERAFVYRDDDGNYYRRDGSTDQLSRSTAERLYPALVDSVGSLSDVPVLAPTTATTEPEETWTTAAESYPAPEVSSITPDTGLAGTTVTITGIYGSDFRPGATVKLVNATTATVISGKSISVESDTEITCLFSIPSTAVAGLWNVTVTNTDGGSGTLAYGFTITNATTAAPAVSGITPSSAFTGKTVEITALSGTNLLGVTSVKLEKSGESDISATNVDVDSSSKITCRFNLNGKTAGLWNVTVIDSAGQTGTGSSMFTIYPVAAFTASNLSGPPTLVVAFTDTSAGSPTIWSWSFGDGKTSVIQSPVHKYYTKETYSVSLTVSRDGVSNTTTKSKYITVT